MLPGDQGQLDQNVSHQRDNPWEFPGSLPGRVLGTHQPSHGRTLYTSLTISKEYLIQDSAFHYCGGGGRFVDCRI